MRFFTAFALALIPAALCAPSPTVEEGALEERAGCATGIKPSYARKVKSKLNSSGVIPTLLPAFEPKVAVRPAYGKKKVRLGNIFKTSETLFAPSYGFTAEPGYDPAKTNYSFFMVDPDVPQQSLPVRVTFLHYYLSHVHPSCIPNQTPEETTFYEALTPGSMEQHRYTFAVYREPKNYVPDMISAAVRPTFDLEAYADKHKLKLVGANFLREAITNDVIPPE